MAKRNGTKRKLQVSPAHRSAYVGNIAVIAALPEERDRFHAAVAARAPHWNVYDQKDRSRFKCFFNSSQGEVCVTVQTLELMGNDEAPYSTSALITASDPTLVLLVGLAGSMAPRKVRLGDVVISNQAKHYSSDKVASIRSHGSRPIRFTDDPSPANGREIIVDSRDRFMTESYFRYERKVVENTATHDLVSEFAYQFGRDCSFLKAVNETHVPGPYRDDHIKKGPPKVHNGWLLSSSHVVDSAEYRDYLVEKNEDLTRDIHRQSGEGHRLKWKAGELLAVDMESYGVLRTVCNLSALDPDEGGFDKLFGGLVIRGISDLCEEKARTDAGSKNEVRRIAIDNAVEVALSMIERLDYSPQEVDS